MIRFKTGDILHSDAEALVNTVNCVGVMGRGIALQFKKAFPANFKEYKAACDQGLVVPGEMFITERKSLNNPHYIINFPTKRHWRGKSRIEDIELGLSALRGKIISLGIKSIAIPPLGSGLGGLNWPDIRERIEAALSDLEVELEVFEPGQTPNARSMIRGVKPPDMTVGRATLVTLVDRYLSGLLDPFVTLIELHKLMYFMQEAGEPLRLQYKKHRYGPYAENLRHVLHAIEGHFVTGYADGGDIPDKQIELVPGASREAEALLDANKETHERFKRVSVLVEGFESPVGMELLATVHWLIHHEGVSTAGEAVEKTHAWNNRKKKFTSRQIHLAYERLVANGWGTDEIAMA